MDLPSANSASTATPLPEDSVINSMDWLSLYESMKDGKMDYNAKVYVKPAGVQTQDGDGDIKLVTPTQAQVEQAKVQMKRNVQRKRYSVDSSKKLNPKRTRQLILKRTNMSGSSPNSHRKRQSMKKTKNVRRRQVKVRKRKKTKKSRKNQRGSGSRALSVKSRRLVRKQKARRGRS